MNQLLSQTFSNHVRHITSFQVFMAVNVQFLVIWISYQTLVSTHNTARCHNLEDHNLKLITVREFSIGPNLPKIY
jgi:hypothetical protein